MFLVPGANAVLRDSKRLRVNGDLRLMALHPPFQDPRGAQGTICHDR